jgi:hypothetical protein
MSGEQMNLFRRWTKEAALGMAVSLLYALFSTLYLLLFFHFVAKDPQSVAKLLPSEFLYGVLWVFFFFFVRRVIRDLRAGDSGRPFRLLVHTLLALLVPPAHLIIYFWLNVVLEPLGIIYIPAMQSIDQAFFDNLFNSYILYGVILAMILFFDTLKKNKESELLRLQAELQQAQLQNLKTRLRPDYIFPVFRRLEGLISSQPERAFALMSKLSFWLRGIQDVSTCSFVPLEEELRLFRAYLDMESFIWKFELKPDLRVDPEALAWPVPPMFLQTLLECVFKASAGPEDAVQGIGVTGRAAGGCLALGIRISGRKFSPDLEVAGSGLTGILRDQLSVLYGGDYLLDHTLGSEKEMEIEMRLPWNEMRPRAVGR